MSLKILVKEKFALVLPPFCPYAATNDHLLWEQHITTDTAFSIFQILLEDSCVRFTLRYNSISYTNESSIQVTFGDIIKSDDLLILIKACVSRLTHNLIQMATHPNGT